jgi:hypothetical protein
MSEIIELWCLEDRLLCGLKDVFDVRTTLDFIQLSQLISSYKWLMQTNKQKKEKKRNWKKRKAHTILSMVEL